LLSDFVTIYVPDVRGLIRYLERTRVCDLGIREITLMLLDFGACRITITTARSSLCSPRTRRCGKRSRRSEDNSALAGRVGQLTRKVAELEIRLGKSSQNSSLPPSSDTLGKRAEATATVPSGAPKTSEGAGKKASGAENKLVRPVGTCRPVTKVVIHEPEQCSSCGDDLSGASEEGFERRQMFDAPQPTLIYTEHRTVRRRCHCGKATTGGFPPGPRRRRVTARTWAQPRSTC
jgi:hypothetical protein